MKGVPVTEMSAVKNQTTQNEAIAKRFFTSLAAAIEKHVESEGASGRLTETCQHVLLMAPLMSVLQDYVGKEREDDD